MTYGWPRAMKACTCCGEEKDLAAFPWKVKGKLHSWCKACRRSYQKRWEKNPAAKAQRADYERRRGPQIAARLSMRRARMAKATPPWLSDEQKEQIKRLYVHAADCALVSGYRYEVDHIIPLFADGICGLHVPWNLQVLPHDLNAKKGKSYDGDDRLAIRPKVATCSV